MVLFVPGGNGHARQFQPLMAALSDRFTCAAFDRRGMSASKLEDPKPLDMNQQARDMLAVIKAMGFGKSIIFGSSLGAIITLIFALDYPEFVEHAIAHEAGYIKILPNYSELYNWIQGVLEIRDTRGYQAANEVLRECFKGFPEAEDETVGSRALTEEENIAHYFHYELAELVDCNPDLYQLRDNGTSVGIMRGERSGDAFYAQVTYEQAKILECPRFDVPGHHLGFESEVDAFVPHFYKMLDALEEKKRQRAAAVA